MAGKIVFSDSEYVASHGMMPRGRGMWAFSDDRNCDGSKALWFSGTLVEAKRLCVAHLRSIGAGSCTVFVLP